MPDDAYSGARVAHQPTFGLTAKLNSQPFTWGVGELAPVVQLPTMSSIRAEVAAAHGFTSEEVRTSLRQRRHAAARKESMWRCRQVLRNGTPRYSWQQIARAHGCGDHTSAIHAHNAHIKRMWKLALAGLGWA